MPHMSAPLPSASSALILVLSVAAVVGSPALLVEGLVRPRREDFVDGVSLEGDLDLFERLADSVGTVLQIIGRGPHKSGDVIQSERSGPLSFAYRAAYAKTGLPKCPGTVEQQCNVAADGLGTIGVVGYRFSSQDTNLVGAAMQTQLACVCVNTDCSLSLLVQPVEISDPDSNAADQPNFECLLVHNDLANKLVACHTEMLRIRPNSVTRSHPDPDLDGRGWNFSVITARDVWIATGFRGHPQSKLSTQEFESYPSHPRSIYSYHANEVSDNILSQIPQGNVSVSLRRGVTPALEGQSNPCGLPFVMAANGASWVAAQQDRHATGQEAQTYLTPQPPLISDTELALVGSSAVNGIIAGIGFLYQAESDLLVSDMYSKKFDWEHALVRYTVTVFLALLAFVMEALPLQVALSQEFSATNWVSEFLHVDVTLAVNGEKSIEFGTIALGEGTMTSNGSVVVSTPVVGKVRYLGTRLVLVATMTFIFDLLFCARLIWHTIKQLQLIKSVWKHRRELAHVETLMDDEEPNAEAARSQHPEGQARIPAQMLVGNRHDVLGNSAEKLRSIVTAVRRKDTANQFVVA